MEKKLINYNKNWTYFKKLFFYAKNQVNPLVIFPVFVVSLTIQDLYTQYLHSGLTVRFGPSSSADTNTFWDSQSLAPFPSACLSPRRWTVDLHRQIQRANLNIPRRHQRKDEPWESTRNPSLIHRCWVRSLNSCCCGYTTRIKSRSDGRT